MLRTILLPYASFRKSVACYSDDVLDQTLQLILRNHRCLNGSRHNLRWRQRDIWHCWSKWKQAFIRVGMMCVEEAKERGILYNRAEATCLFRAKRGKHWRKPLWVGWERLHLSHQATLLHFGEVERISLRLIKWKALENSSQDEQADFVMEWLDSRGFCGLDECDAGFITEVNNYLDAEDIPSLNDEYPNHYSQFNWTERPRADRIVWPLGPEESWVCRA